MGKQRYSFMSWPLYPAVRAPSTHWIGGWVGPRASQNMVMQRKTPVSARD